jgi:hypothetical protein
MPVEAGGSLTRDEACAVYEALPLEWRPATLHPRYVAADARRQAGLQPRYFAYRADGQCWLHSLHVAQIEGTPWCDASSPYGYGGPVCTTDDPVFLRLAWNAYVAWAVRQGIVVEYIRFHPMLGNDRQYGGGVTDNREVVWVDLEAADPAAGYEPRLRSTLNKAARASLSYTEGPLGPRAGEFAAYYRDAMRGIGADPFYLFGDDYFSALAETGLARLGVCSLQDGGQWLAACLLLDGAGMREYHLAAMSREGRQWGAASFALHRAGLAAREFGARRLYLGGGTDRNPGNPLLFFKSSFSRRRAVYRTGATILDTTKYEALKERFPAAWAAHPDRPIFYRKV